MRCSIKFLSVKLRGAFPDATRKSWQPTPTPSPGENRVKIGGPGGEPVRGPHQGAIELVYASRKPLARQPPEGLEWVTDKIKRMDLGKGCNS